MSVEWDEIVYSPSQPSIAYRNALYNSPYGQQQGAILAELRYRLFVVAGCVLGTYRFLRSGIRPVRGGHRLCQNPQGSASPNIGRADGRIVASGLGTAQSN